MLNRAWERQPQGYRDMCKSFGDRMGPLQPTGRRSSADSTAGIKGT